MDATTPAAAALVRRALDLRRSHPRAPAIDVLDVCLGGSACGLSQFGSALDPRAPFGLLVAEALDQGMPVQDWKGLLRPGAQPEVVGALMQVWQADVLPRLAARYGLRH